jgi:hypothetical protein
LSWKDEAAGTEYKVSDFNLETGRVAEVTGQIRAGCGVYSIGTEDGRKLQSAGNVTADPQNRSFSVAMLTASVSAQGPQLQAGLNIKPPAPRVGQNAAGSRIPDHRGRQAGGQRAQGHAFDADRG